MIVGYGLGRYVNPDSDQVGISYGEGRAMNNLGIVGIILVGYMAIYGAVFRRFHRNFWTHTPAFSTIIRMVYLFWWIPLVHYWNSITYSWIELSVLLGIFIGLSMSDAMHSMSDLWFSPNSNPKRRKLR